MIYVSDVKIGINKTEQDAIDKAISFLQVRVENVLSAHIVKTSIDARKREQIMLVHTVALSIKGNEKAIAERFNSNQVRYVEKKPLEVSYGTKSLDHPIVVVGFGPAGMMCALTLALHGYKPIVFERGSDVDTRVDKVNKFWQSGVLDSETNVQFGEGGAGTFSDGKLTTRISDYRCNHVIEQFIKHGAPEEISVKAKPHIGTDNLRHIVKSIRQEIIRLGGQVNFNRKVDDIIIKNGSVCGIVSGGETIDCENVVLAIGHSARDTFKMLYDKGIVMEPKAFSVGARIEHRQQTINEGLYGDYAGHKLLSCGEYALSHRVGSRAVYTFCMCPGGTVVPSSSEQGGVVTNGMSEFSRDKDNANSALVVSVSPDDFGKGVLDGIEFQRKLEKSAYQYGGANYGAIGTDVGSFLNGKVGLNVKSVAPSYSLGVTACDFTKIFPPTVIEFLKLGLNKFDHKIKGFASADAILTGPETRTSSPVRITRGENLQSLGTSGLYPCGEGAGYAGGIMSAGVDGIKIAQEIMSNYKPN
ncbi:MAG: NAD(P)/FAD-dependent oxidoreductase [Oscillospiraceae bacterium]|nr:NAD(P)/FAD-dependent oxidoreductase [Oscillospiraceae bacterium]